jgi:hypothetical protein
MLLYTTNERGATTVLTRQCSTNLVIILVMMQVSKKIPFDDPSVLNAVRALYVVSNVLIAGIYFYVKLQIDKKKGMKTPDNFATRMCN